MDQDTKSWGGKFKFVYVPSWDRFFNKSSNLHPIINLRDQIKNDLKNENIEFIDITDYFQNLDNLSSYYPLGYIGHLNKKGYKKVSDILIKRIFN